MVIIQLGMHHAEHLTNHVQQCTKKDWTPHDKGLVQSCKLELQGSTASCSKILQKNVFCFSGRSIVAETTLPHTQLLL